jgi:hypothetical protein
VSDNLTIPADLFGDVREALFVHLGGVVGAILNTLDQPGRYAEWLSSDCRELESVLGRSTRPAGTPTRR